MRVFGRAAPAGARLAVSAVLGAAAAGACVAAGWGDHAPSVTWIVAAVWYVGATWLALGRMSPDDTASHATREDPTRGVTDLVLVVASVASLAAVGYLLAATTTTGAAGALAAGVGVTSVAAAWTVVHTVFALRYAQLYYGGGPGGIDFGGDAPAYVDFAYVAFTIGMCFQVSDTGFRSRKLRATALRHALLSYLLGAVVLATTINLVAGVRS